MAEDEMAGRHHGRGGQEFEQAPRDGEGQGGLERCHPQGCKELAATLRACLQGPPGLRRHQYFSPLRSCFGCTRANIHLLWLSGSGVRGLSGLGAHAFSSCGMWDLGSSVRDQTQAPGFGRWIPNHWTSRESPGPLFIVPAGT